MHKQTKHILYVLYNELSCNVGIYNGTYSLFYIWK